MNFKILSKPNQFLLNLKAWPYIVQAKLRGMHEHSVSISLPSTASDVKTVTQRIYQASNILQVNSLIFPQTPHTALILISRCPAESPPSFCSRGRPSPAAPWSWSASTWSPSPGSLSTLRTSCWVVWSWRRSVQVWRSPRGKFAFN